MVQQYLITGKKSNILTESTIPAEPTLLSKSEIFNLIALERESTFKKAFRITKNEMDADDLTQEVMETAFVHWESYDQAMSLKAWIHGIFLNELKMMKRKLRLHENVIVCKLSKLNKHEKEQVQNYSIEDCPLFIEEDLNNLIESSGTEIFKRILKMKLIGYAIPEICEELAIPLNSFKWHYYSTMKKKGINFFELLKNQ